MNPPPPDAQFVSLRRLAAIVESSSDAIVAKDLNGIVTDWNPAAEKIFGYAAAEIIGTSITRIIPPERLAEEDFILDRIRRGEKVASFETRRRTKGGREIHVFVTVSPVKDEAGRIVGASKIARDITQQKRHEHELARLNRLYAALSRVNHAIIRLPTQDELFQEITKILVEHGGFSMAWIGWNDPDTRRMNPVAAWGDRQHYLDGLEIYTDDRPQGRGPTGRAFRSGQAYVCNDSAHNTDTAPWREKLLRCGFHASAAFPVRLKNEVRGALTVYAEEPEFFQPQEIALLEEAARDMSFALDNLAAREERRQAEASAENERRFSATMIESMPGIIYFYDERGRFLRKSPGCIRWIFLRRRTGSCSRPASAKCLRAAIRSWKRRFAPRTGARCLTSSPAAGSSSTASRVSSAWAWTSRRGNRRNRNCAAPRPVGTWCWKTCAKA
jgi:PAS domain S-box-containing protein